MVYMRKLYVKFCLMLLFSLLPRVAVDKARAPGSCALEKDPSTLPGSPSLTPASHRGAGIRRMKQGSCGYAIQVLAREDLFPHSGSSDGSIELIIP